MFCTKPFKAMKYLKKKCLLMNTAPELSLDWLKVGVPCLIF